MATRIVNPEMSERLFARSPAGWPSALVSMHEDARHEALGAPLAAHVYL